MEMIRLFTLISPFDKAHTSQFILISPLSGREKGEANCSTLSSMIASATHEISVYSMSCCFTLGVHRVPDKVRIFISIMPISSSNPMFDHLLE